MGLIVAFDPGGTTGCAVFEHTTGRNFKVLLSTEYLWVDRFKIFNIIHQNRANIKAIVIEDFKLFEQLAKSQSNSNMPSSQVIGIITLSAVLCRLDCVVFQTPAQRLNVSVNPEDRSKLHRSKHAIDAYLHAKMYIYLNHRKQSNGK